MRYKAVHGLAGSEPAEVSETFESKIPGTDVSIVIGQTAAKRLAAAAAATDPGREATGVLLGRRTGADNTRILIDTVEDVVGQGQTEYTCPDHRSEVVGYWRAGSGVPQETQNTNIAVPGDFQTPAVLLLVSASSSGPVARALLVSGRERVSNQTLDIRLHGVTLTPEPALPPGSRPSLRPSETMIKAVIAAVVLALAALVLVVATRGTKNSRPGVPIGDSGASRLALHLEASGDDLRLTWDKNSPAVIGAQVGFITISDGKFRRELRMDAQLLRSGSILLTKPGEDVTVGVEVFGRNQVSEMVRAVDGRGASEPAEADARDPLADLRPELDQLRKVLGDEKKDRVRRRAADREDEGQ